MSATPKKTPSSPYQVLKDKPIDQWRVTELKEELKKRKLSTAGLKADLVKRLDEAVQVMLKADLGQSAEDFETPQKVDDSKALKTEVDWVKGDAVDCQPATDEQNVEASDVASGKVAGGEEVIVVRKTTVETITETVVIETPFSESSKSETENDKPKPQLEIEGSKSEIGIEDPVTEKSESQLESERLKFQWDSEKPTKVDNEGFSAQVMGSEGQDADTVKNFETGEQFPSSGQEDDIGNAPIPTKQVSEVSHALGLEVKSDSISSDSMSIIEKNELKDNIIADNNKLELNVKLEKVKPSPMNVAPDAGGSHPMDVEDPHEEKVFADGRDGSASCVDKSSADVEYPEKLNLDRSSGDDSMDEDMCDNKQMDMKNISNVYEDKNERAKIELKDEIVVDVVNEGKADIHVNDKGVVAAEKRKLPDQQKTGANEPVKRQRRWNTDSAKVTVTEPQVTAAVVLTTPKENISPAAGKRIFLRSDSTNIDHTPKERVVTLILAVPPSAIPPTNSLKIDRFLRPFTLKAVQELLGKNGKVTSFWMDHIKTHCYVTYSSVEEAIETRNAVYNLQWPTNGGRLLVADFVNPQEVKNRLEATAPAPAPAAPVVAPPPQAAAPTKQPQPSPRQVHIQQQPAPPTSFPPPPQLLVPPPAWALPPPPPLPEKLNPPIVTLDDLFRKTTTLPRIYYLPLSEDQVAETLAARGKNIKA